MTEDTYTIFASLCLFHDGKDAETVAKHVSRTLSSAGYQFDLLDYHTSGEDKLVIDFAIPFDAYADEDPTEIAYVIIEDIRNDTNISLTVNEIYEGANDNDF